MVSEYFLKITQHTSNILVYFLKVKSQKSIYSCCMMNIYLIKLIITKIHNKNIMLPRNNYKANHARQQTKYVLLMEVRRGTITNETRRKTRR